MSVSPYHILGINKNATDAEIKMAYHKLILRYHPDRNKDPDSISKFREIQQAYDNIINEKQYADSDLYGKFKIVVENMTERLKIDDQLKSEILSQFDQQFYANCKEEELTNIMMNNIIIVSMRYYVKYVSGIYNLTEEEVNELIKNIDFNNYDLLGEDIYTCIINDIMTVVPKIVINRMGSSNSIWANLVAFFLKNKMNY